MNIAVVAIFAFFVGYAFGNWFPAKSMNRLLGILSRNGVPEEYFENGGEKRNKPQS